MVNLCVRSEETGSKFPAHLNPFSLELGRGLFPFRNRTDVVVDWGRHSPEKSSWVNFRGEQAGVLGRTFGEFAGEKLALVELRGPKITSKELTPLERDVTEKGSSKHAAVENTVLEN